MVVELVGSAHLLQHAVAHHRQPVAERHRLGLVVGHVHGRGAQPALDAKDLGARLDPQLGVEVRQRLVHQECGRVADDRASHRHALALAAGQVGGLALELVGDAQQLGGLLHLAPDLLGRHALAAQRKAHVPGDRHVRVQRVVLEDHRHVALARGQVVDDDVVDEDLAVGDRLEPGDHAQQRRLAAARGPDEDHELPVGDVQIDAAHRERAVAVALGDGFERDRGHRLLIRRASAC